MEKYYNLSIYSFKEMDETVQVVLYSLIALFLPMFFKHPQILIGIIINTLLFLTALNIKGIKSMPIIFLPSIGVLIYGALFGSITNLILLFIPSIWIGNSIIVFGLRYLQTKGISILNSTIIVIIFKTLILSITALILFYAGILPEFLLKAMSLIQFITVSIGAIFSMVISKFIIMPLFNDK